MDFQRTVLWVIFAMSLLFLWDNWQRHEGRPTLLGGMLGPTATKDAAPPAAPAGTPAPTAASAPAPADASVPQPSTAPAATPASPAAVEAPQLPAAAAAQGQRVRIETDRLRADFDLAGAVLARAELLQQGVAPDWTAAGLPSLVTGKKRDRDANVVLLEVRPNRVYVAQSA